MVPFPGNESFSFSMPKWLAGQLSSDDLRNIGQALVMYKFLNIFPAIKLILD